MQGQTIRIRLKAFDYRVLDASTAEIVNTDGQAQGVTYALRSGGAA